MIGISRLKATAIVDAIKCVFEINGEGEKLCMISIGKNIIERRKIVLTALLVAVIIFSMLAACGMSRKPVIDTQDGITNILDYVTVEFSGNNGEGIALVKVDYDGMETEMVGGEDKIKKLNDVSDLGVLSKYINAVSSISFSIDNNTSLKNGDQVIVSVSYDESAAQAAGVNFGDQKSKTYVVKGLKK